LDQVIFIVIGALFLFAGIGLAFVKIDKQALEKKSHSNPGLALYQYPAYRWTVVLVSIIAGATILALNVR
jgi:hypothetical protein